MKKAKLMLAGLALFTTVGAALAFKAQNFSGTLFCTTTQGQACAKDANENFLKYSQNDAGIQRYCTTNSSQCSQITSTILAVVDAK